MPYFTSDKAKVKFDLLRRVNAFIQGLPNERFDLDQVINDMGELQDDEMKSGVSDQRLRGCGACACFVGYALLMPEAQQCGLSWNPVLGYIEESNSPGFIWFDRAAEVIFGVSERDGSSLFCPAGSSGLDDDLTNDDFADHRRVVQMRLKVFFEHFGETL